MEATKNIISSSIVHCPEEQCSPSWVKCSSCQKYNVPCSKNAMFPRGKKGEKVGTVKNKFRRAAKITVPPAYFCFRPCWVGYALYTCWVGYALYTCWVGYALYSEFLYFKMVTIIDYIQGRDQLFKMGGQIFWKRVSSERICERGGGAGGWAPWEKFWRISFMNDSFKVLKKQKCKYYIWSCVPLTVSK